MNLFKKATASVALVSLVSGVFSTGVAAMNLAEIEAATSLANKGVINKVDTVADFRLDATITRAEAAKVAAEIAGIEPNSSCEGKFSDVSATTPNTWVCGYVEALLEAGKLSANENYNPERNLSKTESLKMMLEAAGDEVVYDNATWQADFVAHAVANAYISTFTDYNTAATRGFVFVAADAAHEANSDDNILDDILNEIEDGDDTTTDNGDDNTSVVTGDSVLMVELSPESPSRGLVAADRARTPVLAVEVTAGSEDVELKDLELEYTGLSDSDDIDELAVYLDNQKVTRGSSKNFDNDQMANLSFENDTVISAGETKTLVITAKVAKATGTVSHKVTLVDVDASVDVEMNNISSETFNVVDASNTAKVELDIDKVTTKATVGEEYDLADFTLEETSDKEDVVIKALTFEIEGNLDAEEDLSNIELLVDGDSVASDLYVNSDDEIVANIDYTIESDDKVTFKLVGTIEGSISSTSATTVSLTDFYAIGANTEIIADLSDDGDQLGAELSEFFIEGSEINVSFDKSDIDEAKPNTDDVLVGTLKLEALSDYTVEELTVTATANTNNVEDIIKSIELDGSTADKEENVNSTVATYTFEDISLNAGETKELDLTFDVVDDVNLNGDNVQFRVTITKVEDEENDETYTSTSNPDLDTILSTNSLDDKTIDIETATFTLTQTKVSQRELVLGNGIDVILFKGKINVGDSSEVQINDMSFGSTITRAAGSTFTFDDVVDNATLNIGGKTFTADVETNGLDFNSMNAVIAAGSDNVEVSVIATLKDNDGIDEGDTIALTLSEGDIDLEDAEGEDLLSGNKTYNPTSTATTVVLNEAGQLEVRIVQDGDNDDEIEEVVLAGTSNVALAEVEFEADQEDIKVKEMVFSIPAGSTTGGTSPFSINTDTTTEAGSETPATEVTEITFTKSATFGGTIQVNVNGQTSSTVVNAADTAADIATAVAADIVALSNTATAVVSSNKITVTATGDADYSDALVNLGGTNSEVSVNVTTQGAADAAQVSTVDFGKAFEAGDSISITVNGTKYTSSTGYADLATAVSGNSAVSAAAAGNVVTITASVSNVDFTFSASAANVAPTVTGDYSDTITNVRLMNGSNVIADGATITFDSVNSQTLVSFEDDFIIEDTSETVHAVLVADIERFTTEGGEISAVIGDIVVEYNSSEITWASSNDDIIATIDGTNAATNANAGSSKTVSVAPAIVTVSVVDQLGSNGDDRAKIKFSIDKGNNDFDNDDIRVTKIGLDGAVAGLVVRNDDNATVTATANGANDEYTITSASGDNKIINGDEFEFVVSADETELRIDEIEFSIGAGASIVENISITNDKVIDLGKHITVK